MDRETSGAIVVARTADAAAWLSQAFAQHAADAGDPTVRRSRLHGGRARTSQPRQAAAAAPRGGIIATSVEKTYWALVETAGRQQRLPDSGRVDVPILSGKDDSDDSWRAAATSFRVLERSEGFTWLELRPDTGTHTILAAHIYVDVLIVPQ